MRVFGCWLLVTGHDDCMSVERPDEAIDLYDNFYSILCEHFQFLDKKGVGVEEPFDAPDAQGRSARTYLLDVLRQLGRSGMSNEAKKPCAEGLFGVTVSICVDHDRIDNRDTAERIVRMGLEEELGLLAIKAISE